MLRLSSQPIIFVIGSRLIEITIPRGARAESIRLEVDLPSDLHNWIAAIGTLTAQLRPVIAKHRLGGASAVVLYESPSGSTQLTSIVTSREKQSLAAARLAALGAIGGSEETAIADACEVASDAGCDPSRRHVVAAAERLEVLDALAELIDSIGLTTERIVPIDSVAITSIVRAAMSHRGTTHGWLHIGTEQSWLVVVGEGVLRLFRPIRFGLDQLTDVITGPICLNGARADFSLTLEQATKLLAEHGIPGRDSVLNPESGLCGKHIMPLLAPVLQRLIVELKQSLRFGLTESQRGELTLTLCGQGAVVSGLGAIVGDALETSVGTQGAAALPETSVALLPSSLDAFACLRLMGSCPNLLPVRTVAVHMARRFNRGVWIGLAAGLALIAVDISHLDRQIRYEHARLAAVSGRLDDAQLALHENAQTAVRVAAWQRLHNSCVAAADFSPDYSAVLREVALATPGAVRITRLESANASIESVIGRTDQAPTLTVEAYAVGTEADGQIASFVESLRASALVESVSLGSTARSELDGQPARRFDVQVKLHRFGVDRDSLVDALTEAGQ